MADVPLRNVLYHLAGMTAGQTLAEATDSELLARFAGQRDQAAFALLLRRHGPMVLQVCRRLLRQTEDAEDVFQAAFLLLARKATSIRNPDAVGSWLYGVAYRLAIKARARRCRQQNHEIRAGLQRGPLEHSRDASTTPLAKAAWQQVQATLDESLWQLPEKYGAAFILCYLEGMSHEEAARRIGCPLATFRSRLIRGREKLRRELTRRGLTLSASGFVALLVSSAADGGVPVSLGQTTLRAAARFAAGESSQRVVSTAVAQLVEGGLRAMMMNKTKFGLVAVVAALLTTGVCFLEFQRVRNAEPREVQFPAGGDHENNGSNIEWRRPKRSRGWWSASWIARESRRWMRTSTFSRNPHLCRRSNRCRGALERSCPGPCRKFAHYCPQGSCWLRLCGRCRPSRFGR